LSSTAESKPELQNNCQPCRTGSVGAALASQASIGPRHTNKPAKMIATSAMGANEKPFSVCSSLDVKTNDAPAIATIASSRRPAGSIAAGTIASNSQTLRLPRRPSGSTLPLSALSALADSRA
jgi:hypothetical protein